MSSHYRIAVLADIHGNLQALQAVLADLENELPLDGILVAGDMISGPDQQRVLQKLVDLHAVMIQGNNEQAIARIADGTAPEYFYSAKQFALRRWACDHLDLDQLALIRSLPGKTIFQLTGADPIQMAHGSPRNINELVRPDSCAEYLGKILKLIPGRSPNQMDEIFQLMTEPVLILRHVHTPWCEQRDGRFVMNPGAVNVPLNGWIGAQYALLHWDRNQWTPEFRAVRYDMEAFRRANQESGFLSTGLLAQIFLEEAAQGRDISTDFFLLAKQLAVEGGVGHLPYFPDEIWDRAEREFQLPSVNGSTFL